MIKAPVCQMFVIWSNCNLEMDHMMLLMHQLKKEETTSLVSFWSNIILKPKQPQ